MTQENQNGNSTPLGATAALGIAMASLFLGLNFAIISTCFDGAGTCGAFNAWIPNLDFIPLVRRPVAYLLAHGDVARAQTVREIYSYTWMISVVEATLIAGVMAYRFLNLTAEDLGHIAKTAQNTDHLKDAGTNHKSSMLARGILLVFACWVTWGFFVGQGHDSSRALSKSVEALFGNAVHVHDRDFYLPAVIWFFAILSGIWVFMIDVRIRLLRRYARQLNT
jgi:hypothetical protein